MLECLLLERLFRAGDLLHKMTAPSRLHALLEWLSPSAHVHFPIVAKGQETKNVSTYAPIFMPDLVSRARKCADWPNTKRTKAKIFFEYPRYQSNHELILSSREEIFIMTHDSLA